MRHLPTTGIMWLLVSLAALVLLSVYSILYLLLGHATARVFIFRFTIRALWQPVMLGMSAAVAWAVVWRIWLRADVAAQESESIASSTDAGTATARQRHQWSATPPKKWTTCIWTIGGGAVGAALLWCFLVVRATGADWYSTGDGALIELYTHYASSGLWSLGPYSRFGWNHPGSLFFYWMAPFYLASHLSPVALNAGAFALNIASLATILWSTVRYGGAALSGIFAIALGCYLLRMDILLPSAWNPHIVLLPLVLLLVAAAVVASGHLSMLPIVVAAASFTAQTHIGLVPVVVSVTACAVAAGIWNSIRAGTVGAANRLGNAVEDRVARNSIHTSGTGARWRWFAASMALGIVLWVPPLIEQMSPNGGNLSKIVRFFLSPDHSDEVPRRTAIATWATAWSAAARPGLSAPYGNRLELRKDAEIATAVAAAILLLWVFGSWAAHRRRPVEAWCCRLSGIASIVALIAVQRIRGGVADHLVPWVTVIGLVSVASLAAVTCMWFGERVPVLARFGRRWVVSAVTIALLTGSVLDGINRLESTRRDLTRRGIQLTGESPVGTPMESLFQGTYALMAAAGVRKPRIESRGDAWAQMAGIVVQFHKRNIPVAVSASTVWMFGAPLAPSGDEDAELIIADAPSRALLSRRAGDCLLIERDGISVHVLLSSLKKPAAVVQGCGAIGIVR